MKKKYVPVALVLIIYFIFSLSTFRVWNKEWKNTVNGDEQHYLVVASGIARHGVLEQTVPYKEEFRTREIFKTGLASPEANPSPENTHAIQGPNGLFSIHNIGLPLILSLPFLLRGVVGAKIFMILVSGMAVVGAWKISGAYCTDTKTRFSATLATCVALPLIPASNQIYPDILAGIIALSGVYWFMTIDKHRPLIKEGLWIAAIAFLPWLQLKFAATSIILVAGLVIKIYLESKEIRRILLIVIVTIFSFVVLGFYNYYAFGSLSGPYQSGALELSRTAFMVLMGLFFDQNQGFLLQNPIMLVGVFSVGALFAYNKPVAWLWLLVFLSLIVPNALHPNWYGGGSFSGRFEWSAAVVFILPTVFGLVRLAKASTKVFILTIGFSVALQAYFFYQYLFTDVELYNKNFSTWLDSYSIFYFPVYSWMPALYNVNWAYGHWPNFGWLVFIFIIFALGFAVSSEVKKLSSNLVVAILIAGFLVIFGLGFTGKRSIQEQEAVFLGRDLPSLSGRVEGTVRVVSRGVDAPGIVTYGPYISLRKGSYRILIRYESTAPTGQKTGKWDVSDVYKNTRIAEYLLPGTAGKVKTLENSFEVHNLNSHTFEFRTYWDGSSEIQIHEIKLKRL